MDLRNEGARCGTRRSGPIELGMAVAHDLDGTLAALADPTRRRVVDLLRREPRRAGELADAFDMSRPAMSRHLRVLRVQGLVEEARDTGDARARVYRLRPEPIDELQAWVQEVQQFWVDQLESFRQVAEAKAKSEAKTKVKGQAKAKTRKKGRKR